MNETDAYCRTHSERLSLAQVFDLARKVGFVLEDLRSAGVFRAEIVTIPHPSGATAGRVATFLGAKIVEDSADQSAYEMAVKAKQVMATII